MGRTFCLNASVEYKQKYMIWICLVPISLMLIGMTGMPIGYYTLVRIVVCLVSCLFCYSSYKNDERAGFVSILFALIAVLFNPIFPIYLNREAWTVLDIVVSALFAIRYFIMRDIDKDALGQIVRTVFKS